MAGTWPTLSESALAEAPGDSTDAADGADLALDADRADVAASRNGDSQAFERLVRRYQDRVGRWMWRFTRDRNTLEELVQDVFVAAWLSLDGYRERGVFDRWLHRIAVRQGYRFWRRRARARDRGDVALQDWDGPAEPDEREPDAADVLGRLMNQLPPRDRLVLTLRYLEDRPVAETAELTGWSRTMVKVQTFRARRTLRRAIEEAGLNEGVF
jgi:RNA polymerase sigma-70 factor (ECF subfamily)